MKDWLSTLSTGTDNQNVITAYFIKPISEQKYLEPF